MTEADDPDRGSAVLAVMMFAGLAALSLADLAGEIILGYRASEDSLTQGRADWAAMGQAAYVLSRTRLYSNLGPGYGFVVTPVVTQGAKSSVFTVEFALHPGRTAGGAQGPPRHATRAV